MKCNKKHNYLKNRHNHNFCLDCGKRLRWQGAFIKLFYTLFLFLILSAFSFAKTETFTTPITIGTKYVENATAEFNITTEQDTHSYNCHTNSTNTFTYTLYRNISDTITVEELSRSISNFTRNVDGIILTCDNVIKQYGDANTYFKLYTTCNTENEICKKDKADYITKITELGNSKTQFETCSKNLDISNSQIIQLNSQLSSMQGNLSSMSVEKENAKRGRWLFLFGGLLISGGFILYREKQRNPTLQRHKTLGLQGGPQK